MGANFRSYLILVTLILGGCAAQAIDPVSPALTPVITPRATRLTPTQTQADSPPPPGDVFCQSPGSVERYQIDSVLLNGPLFFSVYFPPCYDGERLAAYPVLYALHGQNFDDGMWVDLGLLRQADHLIQEEEVAPFLVVMPYEEFFYRGADANNFPAALKEEIIPWVEQSLNVCAEKECRAIGGISRGASWAMRIGLTEWDFFGAIGAHSLPTFHGDISNLPGWLEAIPTHEEPRIYMDTGRFDPEIKSAYRFERILSEKGIPHVWHLNEGRHNEAYWSEHVRDYLFWYAQGWDLNLESK